MNPAFRIITLLAICGLLVLAAGAYALGIASYERYSGYFAPVWDDTGNGIYFVQRDTSGFVWGVGWEHFTPPASSYAFSDVFSLRHVNKESGKVEVLQTWPASPLVGRVAKHYRGRIFNFASARVEPVDGAAEFVIRMQIPMVPRSDIWTLAGTWRRDAPAAAEWEQKWRNPGGISDRVLRDGIEVITVRGRESFPAAIVTVDRDGDYKVIIQNGDFHALYPDGVPATKIAERSWRTSIERVRKFKETRAELVTKHQAAGFTEAEAQLKASEDLEEIGLLPKRPRLVAQAVAETPHNLKEFVIPPDYFDVGLFQDIAAAIAAPGALVDTGTGTYLKYRDDDIGPKLKAWREAGHDRFVVRSGGARYLLEVRRFD